MADDFLLVQVTERDRGNPKPPGTSIIKSGQDLEEIADYLEKKTGKNGELDHRIDAKSLLFDGGEKR